MMIWKSIFCSEEIEYFVNSSGQSIIGDLKNGGQANAKHVGWIFEVRLKSRLLKKALKVKYYNFCTEHNVCLKNQGKTSSLNLEKGVE